MPASRSRTDRWRDCLWQIHERGGGLELVIDRSRARAGSGPETYRDLVWRVRILALDGDTITVEQPGAIGQTFALREGTPLLGIMTIGQNRWMFHTEAQSHRADGALRLRMPEGVERCRRRAFDRISTAALDLPTVDCWPLIDPRSALPAEVASRMQIQDLLHAGSSTVEPSNDPAALPEVGPRFGARLANIGGGGVGLKIDRADRSSVDATRLYWLRVDLRPAIPAPLGITARLAHTHIDSEQNVYAGMAFEFGLNPGHRAFVVEQIERYVNIGISAHHAA